MIRVALIASTLLRARGLAASLAEDERLEIVDVQSYSRVTKFSRGDLADVIVTVGLVLDEIPRGGPPVVALTNEPLEEMPLRQAVRAVLPLNSSAAEVGAAIMAVANELIVLTRSQASNWLDGIRSSHLDGGLKVEALTARESQVLRMLADGLANKEIADLLRISEHTAKFHVAQILAKLGATSRAEAVAVGMRRGLVPV